MPSNRIVALAGIVALTASAAVLATAGRAPAPRNTAHELSRGALPFALCFAPGASAEEQAAVYQHYFQMNQRYFVGDRWPGAPLVGVNLTYSFPPDGIDVGISPGAGTNVLHQTLDSQFASLGGRATWKMQFVKAFQRWTEVTGNTYLEVNDDGAPWNSSDGPLTGGSGRGDLRIVMGDLGTGGVLAANYFPPTGDMILNFRVNFAQGAPGFLFMRNILMHEHGHGIGMFHSCPPSQTKLMEPFISVAYDGPQIDDIRGSHSLYGDRFEPSSAQLDVLGFVPGPPFVLRDLSLHNASDVDIYLFTAPIPSTISVAVTPVGAIYPNAPQGSESQCPSGPVVDGVNVQNLALELLSPSGQVLQTANVNGLGQGESITNFQAPVAGVYRARVSSAGGSADVQLYQATITVTDQRRLGDLNNDGQVGSTDLGILLGSWGGCPAPPMACAADLNMDGTVGAADLAILLGAWGS